MLLLCDTECGVILRGSAELIAFDKRLISKSLQVANVP